MCVYPWQVYVDVWQKRTQHCNAIIFQLSFFLIKKKEVDGLLEHLYTAMLQCCHSK